MYLSCHKSEKFGWLQQIVIRLGIRFEVMLYLGIRLKAFRFWFLRSRENLNWKIGTWCIIIFGIGFKLRLERINRKHGWSR